MTLVVKVAKYVSTGAIVAAVIVLSRRWIDGAAATKGARARRRESFMVCRMWEGEVLYE